jgi:NAD(P)H dehydrogenase (quinone)
MKHLIIVAHPRPSSFTMSLARIYGDELAKHGHDTHICDLCTMGFNPVLASAELPGPGIDRTVAADVRREQAQVASADALAYIYPLWWASMPAIMKGYIDRIFSYGFAYGFAGGEMRGLLTSKKALIVTVSAAPLPALIKTGAWNAITTLQDAHIFATYGLRLVDHLHFGQIVPDLAEATVELHHQKMRAAARRLFLDPQPD